MKTVNLLYKYVDGAHFFVSHDEETLGLCVAHTDLVKALEAVGSALTKLFKENHGIDVKACPQMFAGLLQPQHENHAVAEHAPETQSTASAFPWVLSEAA